MAVVKRRTRIVQPVGSNSNNEVVEARSSATYGDFASLDARLENFELLVAGASHAPASLAADLEPILSINASQVISLDSQSQNRAFLSPDGSSGDPTFRAIVAADLPSSIVYNTRQVIAGAGLTGGGALSSNVTLDVVAADTSLTVSPDSIQVRLATTSGLQISSGLMVADSIAGAGLSIASKVLAVGAADTSITVNADNIQVRLAATSGLQVSTGLMIADSIAGAGLTIASKVLAVGSGDGIDVSADSIAVDVTDILGTGLLEEATNNIAVDFSLVAAQADLHDPVTLTTAANNNLLSLAAQQIGLDTQAANLVFAGATSGGAATPSFRSLVFADIPSSNNPGAAAAVLASNSSGYLQLSRIGLGVSPSYPLHAVSAANSEALYVVANSLTSGVAFTVEGPLSSDVNTGKAFQVKVNGESFGRAVFYTDGKFGLGSGAATRDVFLSRSAANTWLISSDGGTGVGHIALNSGGTVDGVDISAHAANANAHHNQSHVLASTSGLGADHTVSGLTSGQVLRATGASTATFSVLQHSELGGVSANQHHNQSHVLATTSALGADHTVSGLTARQFLVAASATSAQFRAMQVLDLPTAYSARANSTSDQTISNSSFTTINFGSSRWDTNSFWSAGNPGRVTASTAGIYLITGHVRWEGNATGERVIKLRINNTTDIAFQEVAATNSAPLEISIATVYQLAASDFVQLLGYQNTGGNLDILSEGNFSAEITITKIG